MIKKISHTFLFYGSLLRRALEELLSNDPLRLAGATAFFTTFALPPILVILIQVLRLVLDPDVVREQLFLHLSGLIGNETVNELVDILQALKKLAQNWWVTGAGFIFLLFVATTLFKVIRNSLNQVWKVRPAAGRGVVRGLRSRAKSVAVILVAAILFSIGLTAEAIQAYIGNYVFGISPLASIYVNTVLNLVFSIAIVTIWFTIVFRYLPDGRPEWRIAVTGAFVTALLFTIGKAILHWLLTYSNLNSLYGTSASIVLLLLFVFYSSLILYYGAAFTKCFGISRGKPIRPLPHAIHYKVIEAEVEHPMTASEKIPHS